MLNKLYKMMNWPEIEGIIYSECDKPHDLLGPHIIKNNVLIQFFYPKAKQVVVVTKEESYPMEKVDEEGYFAVLLPKIAKLSYHYQVILEDGSIEVKQETYRFDPVITKKDTEKFNYGIHETIYQRLGAHPMVIDGIAGVHFAVWAPNAVRVSVVGDFNEWDGRVFQMRRLWDSGIFELFIPGVLSGDSYKFELKVKGGLTYLKSDPYANYSQMRPENASVVADISSYKWSDDTWLQERKKWDVSKSPMSVYELHLGSFKKPDPSEERNFYNYRELAPMIIEYVKEMGYTHIELMPVMEHPFDESWGYQVIGYYAPTARYGTPEDFMYFMDQMHQNEIGVILDWVPAHFPRDTHGLSNFDGTCLYEHLDPRKGSHPHWGTLIFNYGRPEVKNYLIANALYWIREFHVDAIRMDAVASMLYLDYGKNDGEWVANMYGGKENLEAIDFLKQLNGVVAKSKDGALMIAEESTAWPMVTGKIEEGGLGFALKWNMGWMNDFTEYMKYDPVYRASHHGELTFSMIYAYSEKFVLVLSHDEVVHGKSSMMGKMPGEIADKFSNLRLAYAYMMMHPGKKLLFMGQDIAELDEWDCGRSVEWGLLEQESHMQMKQFYKALNHFYTSNRALYEKDNLSDGFEWINNISANENVIVFLRKAEREEDNLLVVCNFAKEERLNYKIGVPNPGKYKEIFNSDAKTFGGTNVQNFRAIASVKSECDDRENSICFKMPALAVQVFSYQPFTEQEKEEIRVREEEARIKAIEEAKKRALEEAEEKAKQEAKAAEEKAKQAAKEAQEVAKWAEKAAKEALKKAKADAKEAEKLAKKAQELEKKRLDFVSQKNIQEEKVK